MIGRANSSSELTTRFIQTKTGMRKRVMPGARRLRVVTMKLTAADSEAMPVMASPMSQKSMPCPGLKCPIVWGA